VNAADLADLLRMGRLPEANIAAEPVRALRELVAVSGEAVAVAHLREVVDSRGFG